MDTGEGLLWRDGERVALTPKAFETLVVLVERSGRLVEKDELMKLVWPDSFVEEANLTNNIWALRRVFNSGGNGQGLIETVPKRGYRFTGDVRELSGSGVELVLERRTRTQIVSEEEERTDVSPALVLTKRRWSTRSAGLAVVAACLLVIGVFIAVTRPWVSRQTKASETKAVQPALRSIAVLPFRAIGGGGENEYLSLGLADALITRLGNVREIVVRPTSAVRRYTDPKQDAAAIGRQQGVDAVLEGTYQQTGNRLRLSVQLVRVADGGTIWSSQFDERFTDIFSVQDSISEKVTCDLVTRICGDGKLAKQRQNNIDAYKAYLKGRYFWNKRTQEGFDKAIQYFTEAIEHDPSYAEGHAGLGDAIFYRGGDNLEEERESFNRARTSLTKALQIDETLAEAHATFGLISMNIDRNWDAAEREFKRAIELNPNYATAHQWYGEFLVYMGRFDQGISELKRAQELDPLSLIINTDVGKMHLLARRNDEGIAHFNRVLEMDPNFAEARALLAVAYSSIGKNADAEREMLKVRSLENHQLYLAFLSYIYASGGKRDDARQALVRLRNLSRKTYVMPYCFAIAYAGLGEEDAFFAEIERDLAEGGSSGAVALKVSPLFDSMRSDPRYAELMRHAGF